MIVARNLAQRYPRTDGSEPLTVLADVDLSIGEGEVVVILGPSGSGKTTLLGLLAGLDQPTEGEVELAGVALGPLEEDDRAGFRAENVGFVFQNFQLIPTLTALENVQVPLELLPADRAPSAREAETRAGTLLERVGLGDRTGHYPAQLSGGEQQRVGLARAFAAEPRILFADEPTGNLDRDTGERIADLLFELNREAGTTLVIVTHDMALAERAGRLIRIQAGRIQDDTTKPRRRRAHERGAAKKRERVRLPTEDRLVSGRFVAAMARRELRSSGRRLALYGSCMALGIAALVALTGIRTAIKEAVGEQARTLMGADLMLRARTPFTETVKAQIEALTGGSEDDVAEVVSFGSMALAERSGRTRLVHVQAVEPGFPFYGRVITKPQDEWEGLADGRNAIVDPAVLIQLDLEVGEVLRVGKVAFTVRGAALKAPGTFGLRASVAPRVFIPANHLEATGLVQQGSMVEYLGYLRTTQDLSAWVEENRPVLEAERTTARTVQNYQEDLSSSFAQLTRYLGLVGLTALLLGGVGVAAGVRVFVREKLTTAAVLRALGARSDQVIAVYLAQAGLLGFAGAALGVALGWGVQAILPSLLASFLPVPLTFRLDPWSLWSVSCWAWASQWPLPRGPCSSCVPSSPLRALRREVDASGSGSPPLLLLGGLAAALCAAAVWQAPSPVVGLFFAGGVIIALLVLGAAAQGLTRLLRHRVPRAAPYWLRQGVANLFRPGNQTLPTTLTVGFGLFLVACVQLVQTNLLTELADDSDPNRPNLVLFDVQSDQTAGVVELLESRGTRIADRSPMVPARITGVRGETAKAVMAKSGETEAIDEEERDARWAMRREYRLTYRPELRDTERVVEGSWWGPEPHTDGPSPVSLDRELASRLGLKIGDPITWNIQGVPIESVLANLREIDWGRFSTNFFVVFPPGVLEEAPQSTVLVGHLDGEQARAELQRDLVGEFPNVSVLDATFLLRAVDTIVRQVNLAVRFMAGFTLATGLIVLIAAASTARFQRIREALLLRTLGGRSGVVRRILTTESFVLGALAASVGLGLATIAVWALTRFLFEHAFHLPVADLSVLWLATVGLSTALGFSHARPALARPPLVGLREVEGG